jgi:hypothetical protein
MAKALSGTDVRIIIRTDIKTINRYFIIALLLPPRFAFGTFSPIAL